MKALFGDVLEALAPSRVLRALRELLSEDAWVTRIVLLFLVLQCCWIGWDQPGALSWENDGVAPRDLFSGVANNLRLGHGHRYPLFHNLVLLVCCTPILAAAALIALVRGLPLVACVLSVPSMTAISLWVKLIHVSLGGVLVLVLARIARRLFGATAGRACALAAVVSVTLVYYTRVSNLDGPYMFWSVLAVDRLLTLCERGDSKDYRLLGFLIAASIATKDQAYAGYVLALPLYLVVIPWRVPSLLAAGKRHYRLLGELFLSSALSYAILAGVIVNPTGLLTRLALLTGPNSQEWRDYARTSAGLLLNLRDLWSAQTSFFWNASLVALAWGGVLLALVTSNGSSKTLRLLRLLPFAVALSSVVCFTLPVARAEHRFVLPLGVWLCVYVGASVAWLERQGWLGRTLLAGAGLGWLLSLWQCVELGLTQLGDARHAVSTALAALPPDSVVEIYGFPVYQPHFDLSEHAPYRIQRVGKEPIAQRSQLLQVTELVDTYRNVENRRPAAVVVSEGFARRFLPHSFRPGEAPSEKWLEAQADTDAVAFFGELLQSKLRGYALASCASPRLPEWATRLHAQPISIHDSTANRVWLFLRNDLRNNDLRNNGLRNNDLRRVPETATPGR